MKKLLFTAILSLLSFSLFGQIEKVIVKPEARVATDKQGIWVEYEITMPEGMKWCDVALFLSTDGGNTFNKTPLQATKFDVGRITSSGKKMILWSVLQEMSLLEGKGTDLAFEVRVINASKVKKVKKESAVASVDAGTGDPSLAVAPVKKKKKGGFLIAGNVGTSNFSPQRFSYGGMIGVTGGAGGYVKYRSNFATYQESYECLSDCTTATGFMYPSGNVYLSRTSITGGLLMRASKWFFFYLGRGFGSRTVYWEERKPNQSTTVVSGSYSEDTGGPLAKVSDLSFRGASIDLGAVLRFGKFAITLGVNNTQFKYTEFEAGIGLML